MFFYLEFAVKNLPSKAFLDPQNGRKNDADQVCLFGDVLRTPRDL